MKNTKLAIAIPTYNRSAILKENILLMLPEVQKYSIPIYISDDSTNDETEVMIENITQIYKYIYYFKNSPALGHDKNCIKTLQIPSENYVWYLGDSRIISNGGLQTILEIIEKEKPDFISVNENNRELNIQSNTYINGQELLMDLGWHLTMSGATIYSIDTLTLLPKYDLKKCKNFPQTSLIFEHFALGNRKLIWINSKIIYSNQNKTSYWSKSTFEVFLYDWDSFISNLPEYYNIKTKNIASIKHSRETKLFNTINMLNYRSKGIFNIKILTIYKSLIHKHIKINILILIVIAITPKKLLILSKKALGRLHKSNLTMKFNQKIHSIFNHAEFNKLAMF